MVVSKHWYSRFLKVFLWSFIGLWVVALIALQVALRPRFLTRIANKYAAEYVDGEGKFTNIKASVLKSFPNLNLTVDGFSIVGENPPDTLASLDRLSLSVNYMEALKGRIRIPHAILEHPRIFLHQYDSTRASWDIIKLPSSDDTSSFEMPPLSVGKVSLEDSPFIEYSSVPDSIGIAAALDHLTIKSHRGQYNVDLGTRLSLDTKSTGKMDLPVGLQADLVPDFNKKVFTLNGLKASVAMLDLSGEGMVDMSSDSIFVKARAGVEDEPVKDVPY